MVNLGGNTFVLCIMDKLELDYDNYKDFMLNTQESNVKGCGYDDVGLPVIRIHDARLSYNKSLGMCMVADVLKHPSAPNQLKELSDLGQNILNFEPVIVAGDLITFNLIKGE